MEAGGISRRLGQTNGYCTTSLDGQGQASPFAENGNMIAAQVTPAAPFGSLD